jgi:hypothetical protein
MKKRASRKAFLIDQEKQFAYIDRMVALRERRNRLYNRFYRKAPLYRISIFTRIIFFVFFVWIFVWHGGSGEISQELVKHREMDVLISSRKVPTVTRLIMTTDRGTYEARFEGVSLPTVAKGDTLLVEHTIFGKPARFSERIWSQYYEFNLNWILYAVIGFIVLVSFSFNDGLDRFNDRFLRVTSALVCFAFVHYFFT